MNTDRTVFSQIMDFFPKYEFNKRVSKYNGNYRARTFTCWDQFLCMSFAQLSYRESLRDSEACLTAQPNKLYHMGIQPEADPPLAEKGECCPDKFGSCKRETGLADIR